ncbi:MAG: transcriptional regulator NrdR [Pseudomonadota bacterium]|nr:transcriptional regulator NrdR [Pseudomonadota bacterium]MDE3037267.1 transcriptional regulator NrdR [Pseudomonadota bacterium]
MKCPFCGHADTQVKDSRPSEDGLTIRRRRFCPECNSRFTTFERVQLRELTVLKKNGERRMFDRDKLARSLQLALRKRPVTPEQVEQLVTRVVQKLESLGENEIPTVMIGKIIMDELKKIDSVAYIRFASVYRDFREAKDFEEIVGELGGEE